jgi:F0F1-type ATP synthase assembly protein I
MNQSSGGFELILSGVIFAFIGLWLDRRLGTVPVFTIVLTIVGFGGAVANIYYRYKREIERLDAETAVMRSAGS